MTEDKDNSLNYKNARIKVGKVVSSRYDANLLSSIRTTESSALALRKPVDWTQRKIGYEEIESECGQRILLYSEGHQGTPVVGDVIILRDKFEEGFKWTLYGL